MFLFLLSTLAASTLAEERPALPAFAGVAVSDLADRKQRNAREHRALARRLSSYAASEKDFALHEPLSISMHELKQAGKAGTATVDIFGRDPRFTVIDKRHTEGLGFLRAEIDFEIKDDGIAITGHRLALQRDFSELRPRMSVSLSEQLAVISDEKTGFRRVVPLGVGAIDAVRFPGITTLMTPTTEHGRLDKRHLWRAREKPKYYRGKPFINVRVPVEIPENGKPVRYRTTIIGFHIWQNPAFRRGYLSHGCIRMRDADLDELLAVVEGVRGTLPIKIRIKPIPKTWHPFPKLLNRYVAVKNYGTKEKPEARKTKDDEGAELTDTEMVAGRPPKASELTDRGMDPEGFGPSFGTMMEEED
jgi:hypothetical protein